MSVQQFVLFAQKFVATYRNAAWGVLAVVLFIGITGLRTLSKLGTPKASAAIAGPVNSLAATNVTTALTRSNSSSSGRWGSEPVAPMTRNIFYINIDHFPRDPSKPAAVDGATNGVANGPPGEGFWNRLAKSGALRAEDQDNRSRAVDSLQWQAAQLHLQTILMGPTPKVMVDGQLLQEGDGVAGFRVVKITARCVLLEREGSKFEVAFK